MDVIGNMIMKDELQRLPRILPCTVPSILLESKVRACSRHCILPESKDGACSRLFYLRAKTVHVAVIVPNMAERRSCLSRQAVRANDG